MSAAPVLKSTIAVKIDVVHGPHKGQSFSFDKSLVTLGRGSENDIVLSEDPKISRNHAEIRYTNGSFEIHNLSEKNFLVVRGQKVKSQALEFGDKIFIGESEIIFNVAQTAVTPAPKAAASAARSTLGVITKVPAMKSATALRSAAPPIPQANSVPAARPMPPPISHYQNAPQMQAPPPNYRPPQRPSGGSSRLRFYGIIAVVLVAGYWFLTSGRHKKPEVFQFGPSEAIQRELLQAEEAKKSLEELRNKNDTQQYRRAQENFQKGFRDFRQGQYGRAREAFQVVLTLDPQNEEAKRYLVLAKLKFDEQIKDFVNHGRANFENKNYRLCKSDFLSVMTMLNQNTNDPSYLEAKKLFELCDLAQGGR